MTLPDCLFCKIIRGELPTTKIYEDEKTFAFLDIHPVTPGHTLVIPKNGEAKNIFDVSPNDWSAVMETVRKLSIAIEKGLQADGVNLMMNNREHAGQIIMDHLHIHIIPRFKNDGLRHWPGRSYTLNEKETVAEKIKSAI